MTRVLQFFALSLLMVGLVACGQRTETPPLKTEKAPITKPEKSASVMPEPEKGVHKVGLLLPLSGPHKKLGHSLLNAAEMALFETKTTSVVLLPQDTNRGAAQAASRAISEGAELILGPIFAPDVKAVKPLVASKNISLICFSTDQSVAGNGVYILGFLPSQQIKRVVDFASEKGLAKIAVFTPNDPYGHLVDSTLKSLGNVQLLGISHYDRGDLLEGNPGNERLMEEARAYKTQGAQAFLIPEGGANLAHLMNLFGPEMFLSYLGSGQWDSPETLHLPMLEGGYFASTNPSERQGFETRFKVIYGYTPPRIATLAYDATALAVILAGKGYTAQNLTAPQGFAGVDGLFRLTPNGLNERALGVFQISSQGGAHVVSSPAASF